MESICSKLTVFFESPFWVGVYERECGRVYEVCKITFGAEPKEYEVYDFLRKNYHRLMIRPSFQENVTFTKIKNPKRLQRAIHRQVSQTGAGTKAQQAIKKAQEEMKKEHKVVSAQQREQEKIRRYELHQKNRKEKHRGH